MRENPVEILTVVNPSPRDKVIGEALTKSEAKKLADWWNENYQPEGYHVHHFLRFNEAYSRLGKKRYDVFRKVVEKNPESSGGTKWDRYKYFLLFGAIGSVRYYMYSKQLAEATTAEEAQRVSRNHLLFGIGGAVVLYLLFGDKLKELMPEQERERLARNPSIDDLVFEEVEIGGGTYWNATVKGKVPAGVITTFPGEPGYFYRVYGPFDQWQQSRTLEDAKRDLFDDFMELHVADLDPWEWEGTLPAWWPEDDPEENPAERYFVRLPREGVTYPKKGSKYYPAGYPLRKAQDFARIGSQTGGPREVRRGRRGGKRVRIYTKGKRTWPTTKAQVKNLLPAEIPKNLRAN